MTYSREPSGAEAEPSRFPCWTGTPPAGYSSSSWTAALRALVGSGFGMLQWLSPGCWPRHMHGALTEALCSRSSACFLTRRHSFSEVVCFA